MIGGFFLFDNPDVLNWMENRLADVRENLPSEVPKP